jgi:hypothetical protein
MTRDGTIKDAARGPMLTAAKRVAVVAPDLASLTRLRGDLLAAMVGLRHRVLCLVPETDAKAKKPADQAAELKRQTERAALAKQLGVEIATYPLRPGRPSMFGEGAAIKALTAALTEFRPHVLLGYGPKAMLLANRAGAKANIGRRVALITSLGPAFTDETAAPHLAAPLRARPGRRACCDLSQ